MGVGPVGLGRDSLVVMLMDMLLVLEALLPLSVGSTVQVLHS